tara:strand:- start:6301 stop:7110 length:810 start_codon:yes stop_codon:yes gene_type:complete
MALPKNNPTTFCKAFIERELESYHENSIWMSYWPVMENMVNRSDELKIPFAELIQEFGYSDKFEGIYPENSYIWLVLEHIWCSINFSKQDVVEARNELKELKTIQEDIVELALQLSSKLRKQSELYEISGFQKHDYQSLTDLIEQASENNYLYHSNVSSKIKSLTGQYDLKYWPNRADLVEAIATFENIQPVPGHSAFPNKVIDGRESDLKDFVLSFDNKFSEFNDLPKNFRFTNNAMADIINIVLDLPAENLASGDAIRVIRNRFKKV